MVLAKLRPIFRITVDFKDIDQYVVDKGPVNISYTLPFALQEARAAAGIDSKSWEVLPGTPLWMTETDEFSKCHILVWWKYRNQIEAVQATARNREMRKQQRRGR